MTEWTIPTPSSGVTGLTLDQSGSCCWFVEYYGNKLGHFNPLTNLFQEWMIPTSGANPYDLALISNPASPSLWGTEYGSDRIFAFSPETGSFIEYRLPHADTGVGYISIEPTGPQVRVWFTETLRNVNGELIYDPSSGNATLYEDYFPSAMGGGAYGVYAQSNSVWFAGFSALTRWDRASQQYTVWPLPVHGSAIGRFVTIDSFGQAWYTQGTQNATSNDNFLGVLRSNGIMEEWKIPSQGADPRKVTVNPQSLQPWFAERSLSARNGTIAVLTDSSNPNLTVTNPTTYPSGGTPTVLAYTSMVETLATHVVSPTVTEAVGRSRTQFTEYPVGSSDPRDVVIDSRGNVWFTEPGTNQIGEFSGFASDFALSASPPLISLPTGGSGSVSIVGTAVSGYQGSITLSTLHLPQGVTIAGGVSPIVVPPGAANASVQVAIDIASNATVGSSEITFEGNDGATVHETSVLLTVTNTTTVSPTKPQCLIATATFGSTLSPEVELLRGFRDKILRSRTGEGFLIVFNSWYYSFSPYIANYISEHSSARGIMRLFLSPLIGSLAFSSLVYSVLGNYPDCATLMSGLLASCLLGAFYLGLPLGLIKRILSLSLERSVRLSSVLLMSGLLATLVGLRFGGLDLLMVTSVTSVMSAMYVSAALTVEALTRLCQREKLAAQI